MYTYDLIYEMLINVLYISLNSSLVSVSIYTKTALVKYYVVGLGLIICSNKKSESLQTEGRHFRSMICKINDV